MPCKSLLSLLGVKLPIIQAPMAGVSTPSLAAKVTNAGGVGSIGIGAMSNEDAEKAISDTMKLTDKPFNVNVFCHQTPRKNIELERKWINQFLPTFNSFKTLPPKELKEIYQSFNDSKQIDILIKLKPKIVSFHFGLPCPEYLEVLKNLGITTLATATSLEEAHLIEQAGIDIVVAQGIEAGGHRGVFELTRTDEKLSTIHLLKKIILQTSLPVVAAGGIMNGNDIFNALNNGAMAVQMGTAFLLCPEANVGKYYHSKIKQCEKGMTTITSCISGRPARGIINQIIKTGNEFPLSSIPDYPYAYDLAKQLNNAAVKSSSNDYSALWAGTGVTKAREMTVENLIKTLEREINEAKQT
ncbi:nitronate monooxygenase [Pseudoalteromonas distincta]|jgi:nitronate monooxygenase|uniref:Uncharacterized protein n=1 Tax=marine sediment metagenome TaxID=412755 RepID=A0A0F9NI43_9ZZZZ|nr:MULTISPECIES: nitronate monooxygenase [Pseudoalteromonas]MBB1338406.1 nitronate monooxygenase [Pseudoalteromonas sp. SR44-2]MDC3212469.1 nitronate monooxygenase [Pseudoalteromonas distincta]MDN3384778.1 nitronate monooxygenase [Pseudoalteromonas sp. APC 3358]